MHRQSGELDCLVSVVACVIIDTRTYCYRDNCSNYHKKGSKLIINRGCVCNQQFSGAGPTPLHTTIYTNAEILNLWETNSRIALNISCQLQSYALKWPLANMLRILSRDIIYIDSGNRCNYSISLKIGNKTFLLWRVVALLPDLRLPPLASYQQTDVSVIPESSSIKPRILPLWHIDALCRRKWGILRNTFFRQRHRAITGTNVK